MLALVATDCCTHTHSVTQLNSKKCKNLFTSVHNELFSNEFAVSSADEKSACDGCVRLVSLFLKKEKF